MRVEKKTAECVIAQSSADLLESEMVRDVIPAKRARGTRRPRVSQACMRCRAGKIRCDGRAPTCSPCADRSHCCVYPAVRKMRGPGKSKQRIEALEERLVVMESMLRQDPKKGPSDTGSETPEPLSGVDDGSSPPNPSGSSFSKGMTLPFHRICEHFTLWPRDECTKILDKLALSSFALEASELWLVEQLLDDVCAELPFLRIPWLLDRIRCPDAVSVPDAWFRGVIHAIIASAMNSRMLNRSFREVAVHSWTFFQSAYAVLPELIARGESLGAAQAVMAMAMFMRQSADTRTTSLLLSIAIRMQYSVCLHTRATAMKNMPPTAEEENRGRLFWAAFILDMDMTVNTGQPPMHADLGVFPDLPVGSNRLDLVFRHRAQLAKIQQRVGTQLINPRQAGLFALESELEAWNLQVPPEIRPDWHGQSENAHNSVDQAADLSVNMLHLVYYNNLSMICWASVRHVTEQFLESPQAIDSLHNRTSRHKSIARAAARAAIRSVSKFPTQSFVELWKALCYPVSASIVILALVCKEPTHVEVETDLMSLTGFVKFLERMVRDEGCNLERMRDGISTFEKVARHAVNAALSSTMPVNPALWPLSAASGHTGKTIATLLTCSSYHPIYMAQSFMGNMPNRDTDNAKQLAEILGLPWGNNGYGPFVPDSLMPASYGFPFGSGSPG